MADSLPSRTTPTLIVFARKPVKGKVKTRLAKTIGDKDALKIYTILLKHTESVLHKVSSDKVVYYSEEIQSDDLWDDAHYQKKLQKGTEGVIGFKQEQEQVSVGFNNSIEKMSSVVRKTISDSTVLTDKWVVLSIKDIKQGLEPTYHSKDFLRGIQSIENNLWKQLIISHLTKKN